MTGSTFRFEGSRPIGVLKIGTGASQLYPLRSIALAAALIALLLPQREAMSASTTAAADPSIPVCIYASKNYSSGALVCVQKSVALVCRSEGLQAAWVTVTDKEVSERCDGPTVSSHPRPRLRAAFRARRPKLVTRGANSSLQAKCFDFAGKRYCE